ncbi:MAG: N-acetyltransferase [Pacificimonas sp.]
MTPRISIRGEDAADAATIHDIVTAAFRSAPHASGTEAQIVRALRDEDALTLSLVASDAGNIVGHLAASPVRIGNAPSGWLGIGPVSVTPAWQGEGIGSALILSALSQLRGAGHDGCVVLGDPVYYRRFGFRRNARLLYPGPPPECFLCLPFGGSVPSGVVSYHPAFGAEPPRQD